MPQFSDPDIEEDDECCVVRIAPRPIKLKIKPIVKLLPFCLLELKGPDH